VANAAINHGGLAGQCRHLGGIARGVNAAEVAEIAAQLDRVARNAVAMGTR